MAGKQKLYSYIVTHDAGFAPNPFWGYCTLACCKPKIRKTAQKGDWIVGLSPKAKGHKIIYAMQVDEILPHKEYFCDRRFAAKIPKSFISGNTEEECGDNIYKPLPNEKFRQLPSHHSNTKKPEIENPKAKKHDLSVKRVLISKRFHYFGKKAIDLPKELCGLKVRRGHRNRFSEDVIKRFLKFIDKQRKGFCAIPAKWYETKPASKTKNRCGLS